MNNVNVCPDILLFTRGTKGDLYPFLRLGAELKAKGCRITLLSNYCYESYADKEGFEFVALDDKESFEALNNNPKKHANLASKFKFSKEHIVSNLEREIEIIKGCVLNKNTTILAHSNDYLAPLVIKEKLNIPLFLCVLAPSYIHGFSLYEALLYGLSSELNKIRGSLGLLPLSDWKKWLNSFDQGFAFWPSWFSNEASSVLPELTHLGFLSIDSVEDARLQCEVKAFVEGAARKILITHGTSMPFNNLYFKLGLNASQKMGCKLIVSTPFRDLLPDRLPENVIWVKFCPFHELLPYIDLIIHHGGIGTIREAIAHSVPQLIIGQGFDRQHNARLVRDLGVGDWIIPKALSVEVLIEKVRELLESKNIRQKCDKIGLFLYDQNALELFFGTVMRSHEKEPACLSAAKNAVELNEGLGNFPSSMDVEVDNCEDSLVEKSIETRAGSIKNILAISKQELLHKMVKRKNNGGAAMKNMFEAGRE